MKILNLMLAFFFVGITAGFSQNNTENSSVNSKNVKTETVDVNGTKFSYRKFGTANGNVPVIFLNHLAGALDDWDPRVLDGVAAKREIITFDNRGVGSSEGETPKTVEEMADDAIAFIHSLGYKKVDLLGFSLGGAVAQSVTLKEPQLVRKLILAGTGQAGSVGADKISGTAYKNQLKSMVTFTDVRTYLFFTRTKNGKKQAKDFINRTKERTENRDTKFALKSFKAQLAAIHTYALQETPDLSKITQPTLIVNGDSDKMIPSINSAYLSILIPNSKLILYKDAGHGGIFQYHDEFVKSTLAFLEK